MRSGCLECGEKLLGRVDKKFCSDHCRNSHHNRKNKERRQIFQTINRRLSRNYRILESFPLRNGRITTTHKKLADKGFDFDLLTSIYTTRKGASYRFIYDMGYLPIKENRYVIVKKEQREKELRTSSSPHSASGQQ